MKKVFYIISFAIITCSCNWLYEDLYSYFIYAANHSKESVWFLVTEDALFVKQRLYNGIIPAEHPFNSCWDTLTLDNYNHWFTLVEPDSTGTIYVAHGVRWKMSFPSDSIIVRVWKDETIQQFGGWEIFLKDNGQNCKYDAEIDIQLRDIHGLSHYITYPSDAIPR